MRTSLMFTILIFLVSCADMHEPILHGGGAIKFVPECSHEIDSVIIDRMTNYFEFDWTPEIFSKELDDYHVSWMNSEHSYDIDFIRESELVRSDYGEYEANWYTNPYNNNRVEKEFVFTDHANDTICRPPDFVYSKTNKIFVKESIHDYIENEGKMVQVFNETLLQRSFLYVVQVKLKNNRGRVINAGTTLVTGQAEKFNIKNELNYGSVCHTFSPRFERDIIVGSYMSFGLPKYNSYSFRYNYRNGFVSDEDISTKNILYIQIIYKRSSHSPV